MGMTKEGSKAGDSVSIAAEREGTIFHQEEGG